MILNWRNAAMDDAKDLYKWRNNESSRIYSGSSDVISWSDHERWLSLRLEKISSEPFFIFTTGDSSIGMSRFDLHEESKDVFEISILVNPDFRNLGYGSHILKYSCDSVAEKFPNYIFAAKVHFRNTVSRKLFSDLGFTVKSETGHFMLLEKSLSNFQ